MPANDRQKYSENGLNLKASRPRNYKRDQEELNQNAKSCINESKQSEQVKLNSRNNRKKSIESVGCNINFEWKHL